MGGGHGSENVIIAISSDSESEMRVVSRDGGMGLRIFVFEQPFGLPKISLVMN